MASGLPVEVRFPPAINRPRRVRTHSQIQSAARRDGRHPRGCAPRGRKLMTIRSLRALAFGAVAVAPACAQSTDARVAEAGPGVGESVPRLVQFNGTLKDAAARPLSGA